ncbi:MAG TPA: hypothetical protein VMV29_02480 [Ktedonobacterales bacterium]|nr:hypothetical protein [Ktedonobacterales bacterium]
MTTNGGKENWVSGRRLKDLVQWQTVSGQPIVVHDVTLIPQSRALIVRLPRSLWVWNRPTAVRVEQHGQVKRLPISDLTRRSQLGLFAVGVAMGAIVGFVQFARSPRNP